jgi:sugar porter (SP) family MFS transporter
MVFALQPHAHTNEHKLWYIAMHIGEGGSRAYGLCSIGLVWQEGGTRPMDRLDAPLKTRRPRQIAQLGLLTSQFAAATAQALLAAADHKLPLEVLAPFSTMAPQQRQPETPGYSLNVSPGGQPAHLLAEERSLKPTWVLYVCVFSAMLQAFHYGWSNSQVNYSKFNNTEECKARPIEEGTCMMFPGHTKTTWTLLVNAWIVGGMFGSLVSGFLANKLGRRQALRYNSLVMIVGCIFEISASNAGLFTAGRFIVGIANGIAMSVVNTYFSEISTPHNRHALGINTHLAATLGIFGVATTFWYWGTSSGWRYIAAMPILNAIGFLGLSFTLMVESPVWLVTRGKDEEAEHALGRLYGKENVATMMSWIQANDRRSKLPSVMSAGPEEIQSESAWQILSSPKFHRPLLIAFGLTCVNQLVGINAVFFYSSSILKDAGIADSRAGLMIIDILNVVPVPIAAVLTKVLRKRVMLLSGIFLMVLCCVGMTFSLVYSIGWLSIVFLGIFVVGYDLSIGPLLWPIIGELFPDSARGNAVGVCLILKWLCALAIGIGFPYVEEAITNYSFTPFLGTCTLSILFIYFMVPETSDMTIAEIQKGFRASHSLETSHKSQQ